ncbi:hypothetical protein CHARACLAT_032641 [Characodon lateralis]|uniref:Uncharacterized protein n=1 Tax=Characodon lateralis TaxID=208331 RepID=A0ABU7F936_9TELE|nr:hypothetical protein [Characodon lateralis]
MSVVELQTAVSRTSLSTRSIHSNHYPTCRPKKSVVRNKPFELLPAVCYTSHRDSLTAVKGGSAQFCLRGAEYKSLPHFQICICKRKNYTPFILHFSTMCYLVLVYH